LLGRHYYHLNPLTSPDSPMKENELWSHKNTWKNINCILLSESW
jgi:hypothetical protein